MALVRRLLLARGGAVGDRGGAGAGQARGVDRAGRGRIGAGRGGDENPHLRGLEVAGWGYSLRTMRIPRMKRIPAMMRPPIRRDW